MPSPARELTRDTLIELIGAALAAPSAENRHHVSFSWNGIDTLSLHEQLPEPHDSGGCNARLLSLFGAGAMTENIIVRASQFGLAADVQENFDGPWRVDLRLQPEAGHPPDPLDAAIALRHTNRKWFRAPGLGNAQKHEIEIQVNSPTERILWLDDPALRKAALDLIWRAESERLTSPQLHRELFEAIRFDVGWKTTAEEGLPPACLEIEAAMRPGFRVLSHWPVAKAMSMIGVHRVMGLRAGYLPARGAPNLALFLSSRPLESACFAVGRQLERAWLQITAFGLNVQPLAASCLLGIPGWQGVSADCANKLQAGWKSLSGNADRALMLVRVGTADRVAVRTSRKPVRSVHVTGIE